MLEQLQLQDKMKWVYLVPPNLYGPGDHFGQKDTHFVPATVKNLMMRFQLGKRDYGLGRWQSDARFSFHRGSSGCIGADTGNG